jgi:hypothetical protein
MRKKHNEYLLKQHDLREKLITNLENIDKIESDVVDHITLKLHQVKDWSDDVFQQRTFTELRASDFKRLTFISDILEEWDLSHLTGYPSIIANSGLGLNRKTDEITFYEDLFKQLDRDKLIHFLAWAVAGEELDESIIDKIVMIE